ncbi:hypothetical protein CAMGR0001_0439 [Campylobacter gracilis RM3268]|uniref:Uncharacterized protein n=1 Tax=Campylobacter gracilis RM3268 TaxID=553220 RepID=C8PHJ4_9BACT|nr:hypothetical protein CAMGR0001_0439 [Campylobacter gracilis RM3268]
MLENFKSQIEIYTIALEWLIYEARPACYVKFQPGLKSMQPHEIYD